MKELASSWARTGRIILRNLLDRKHEPESAYLNRFLEPGGVCLHVGASDGRHTVLMSRLVGSAGHVYCFEPSTFTLAILERAIWFHRIRNVTTFNVAVADSPGSTLLVTPVKANGHLGRSFAFVTDVVPPLEPLRESRGFRALHSEQVPVWTLDEFCNQRSIEQVAMIRCDVEGAEMRVLAGARAILQKHRPTLLLEVHPHSLRDHFETSADAVRDLLAGLGYRFFYVDGDGLSETTAFFDEPWRDYYCVPEARVQELALAA